MIAAGLRVPPLSRRINVMPYRSKDDWISVQLPGCDNAATWAVLSEQPRESVTAEWGIWNYAGTLACDEHRDNAETEALGAEKHYRLIPVPANA
jgi:hypothetical protein